MKIELFFKGINWKYFLIFSVADKISVGWRGLISERDRGIGDCEDPLMLPSPSSHFYPPNEIRCLHLALICLFLSSDKKIRTCMLGLLKYSVASKRYISIVAIKRIITDRNRGSQPPNKLCWIWNMSLFQKLINYSFFYLSDL